MVIQMACNPILRGSFRHRIQIHTLIHTGSILCYRDRNSLYDSRILFRYILSTHSLIQMMMSPKSISRFILRCGVFYVCHARFIHLYFTFHKIAQLKLTHFQLCLYLGVIIHRGHTLWLSGIGALYFHHNPVFCDSIGRCRQPRNGLVRDTSKLVETRAALFFIQHLRYWFIQSPVTRCCTTNIGNRLWMYFLQYYFLTYRTMEWLRHTITQFARG